MIDSQYKLKGKASYSITNDLLGKYVPSFFLKLMPWRITNKGIQNELINGSKPLQYFNMLDYFLFPLKWGIMKTNRAPCSSPWKTKQHATMTKASSACRGQNVNTFNEHSSRQITLAAHRSGLWQETWDVMNGSPPTHASELTLGRGSKGRTTIASGKQSFPSQTSWDTPYSPVMVWVEDFFPCTQIALFQQVWYILPPIHSGKLPRTCKASWDFQQSSRGTQSLAGSGGQKTTTGGEVLHRANNLNHLMIVYHSAIIPILGTTSPLIL